MVDILVFPRPTDNMPTSVRFSLLNRGIPQTNKIEEYVVDSH